MRSGFLSLILALSLPPIAGADPAVPQRLISLSPNLTEIIYDIGAQDRLVGDTDFCKFPPAAAKKEKIGGWIDPNFEKIVSLKPDLVLAQQFHEKALRTFPKLHIPFLVLDCDSIQAILKTYTQLGKVLGCERQAQKARQALEKRLAVIQKKAKGRKPVSILFVVSRTPDTLNEVYAVGSHNFVEELIEMAGGKNVMLDAGSDYPMVSKEQLVQRDPDIIVDAILSHEIEGDTTRTRNAWNEMPSLKAVRNHQVYYFSDQDFMMPGPSMVKLGEYLSKIFGQFQAKHE